MCSARAIRDRIGKHDQWAKLGVYGSQRSQAVQAAKHRHPAGKSGRRACSKGTEFTYCGSRAERLVSPGRSSEKSWYARNGRRYSSCPRDVARFELGSRTTASPGRTMASQRRALRGISFLARMRFGFGRCEQLMADETTLSEALDLCCD